MEIKSGRVGEGSVDMSRIRTRILGYQESRVDTHSSIGVADLVGRDRAGRRGPCAIQLRDGKCLMVLSILGISIPTLNFEV
jgi:hypothetical protein